MEQKFEIKESKTLSANLVVKGETIGNINVSVNSDNIGNVNAIPYINPDKKQIYIENITEVRKQIQEFRDYAYAKESEFITALLKK